VTDSFHGGCDVTGFLHGPSPRAFAHRGWHTGDLAGLENSMAAFARAVDEGFRYLETDVHVTSDGRLVAFHDYRLDRVTDGSGLVAQQTWDRVRRARIGGREPIPLMAEVLATFPDVRLNIDPKSDAAVGPLLDLIRESGSTERVCIGAFSDRRLRAIRAAAGPSLATSLGPRQVFRLVSAIHLHRVRVFPRWHYAAGRPRAAPPVTRPGHALPGVVAAQVPVKFGRVTVISPAFVGAAHASGLEVHAWTIDDPGAMNRLLDLGVDGIMTDRPDVLRSVLQARGAWV
jgi:glycerophosphoryl diester phosphodiesterase